MLFMTRVLRPLPAVLVLGIVASGLTHAQSQPQAQPKMTMAGYPAPGSPATITVASTGAEPKTRLRYKVAAGQNFAMEIATNMSVTVAVEGMAIPAMDMPVMKMTANIAVKNVAANGDITYDLAFSEMTAEGKPGMDPSLVAMVQGAASQITQLKGTLVVSDRGVTKSGDIDVNKVTDPNLRQTLTSLASQLESLSVPLPEEAVGVGAKWEVRQALNAAGVQMFQRMEAELASIDASSVTLRIKSEQTTPPQPINNPSLPAGATVEIEKMSGTGAGTMKLQFDSLVPTSELTSTQTGSMAMSMAGMSQKMNMDMKATITVGPKKK